MPADDTPPGGWMTAVRRVGDTARRPTGPWSPSVHRVLEHLGAVGFAASPRFHGVDPDGCEVLDWIDGRTVGRPPWPTWAWDDRVLIGVGRLLREYHDAVRDVVVPDNARWRTATGRPGPGEVVCHNDVGPPNLVFDGSRIVGLIDWDLAAPARPAWDLAHAAWMTVPLMDPASARVHGIELTVDEQAERLRMLCLAYGLAADVHLVRVVTERIDVAITMATSPQRSDDRALAAIAVFVPAMRATAAHVRTCADALRGAVRR
jgi:aminoglycoside phosphotransferase (APT) family kinase protein